MIGIIILLFSRLNFCFCANWAQSSGDIKQNIVIPYYPSPPNPHWAARYGMVSVVAPPRDTSSLGFVYLMGGDTYDGSKTSDNFKPGLTDSRWENGYKNDVWKMSGTEWLTKGDPRLRSHHQKIPRVTSQLKWTQMTGGLHPPPGTTYDKWLKCQPFFQNLPQNVNETSCKGTPPTVMWSPRRNHAGIFFNNYIWVMGGRAREFVALPEDRSVGGIMSKRIEDIPLEYNKNVRPNMQILFTTQREVSVYKSDVWRSQDGITWELVNPGCKNPQSNLIADGNVNDGKHGLQSSQCKKDADCYGNEYCDKVKSVCTCNMWTPRENHAVAAYKNYMYVSGGFASRLYSLHTDCGPYACGDTDASAYRYYMSDIWRSADGKTWSRITFSAFYMKGMQVPLGRGGHQMIAIEDKSGVPYMWVIGGRGGDNSFDGQGAVTYYNDIWVSPLSGDSPEFWQPYGYDKDNSNGTIFQWQPRLGHTVSLEIASPDNMQTRTLYLYGGYNNGTYLDDLWAWRLDYKNETWRQDFTDQELFSTGAGQQFHFDSNSPAQLYVEASSNITLMQRYAVPYKFLNKKNRKLPSSQIPGLRLQKKNYLSNEKIALFNKVGINTISDLANIDLLTVLLLRGFTIPQVPKSERYHMTDVCDFRALAQAVIAKCSLNLPSLYDGEKNMPWNILPEFGGGPPPATDHVAWHHSNYKQLEKQTTDPSVLLGLWDGCTYSQYIQGLFGPNVEGIGYVTQIRKIRDPLAEVQELFCKQTPGTRAFHNMVMFEERLYVMGGKSSDTQFNADTWYRDPKLPTAKFESTPALRDTNPWFKFVADKPGVYFEYRVVDPYNYKELRPWSTCTKKTDIGWLNWRKKGPGNGIYRLYVRAVDPAGNRDEKFYWNQNVYEWYYVSPTPWDIIAECVGGFIGLCIIAYLEYRRRVKKAAMERYAMKRMRRKFKAMQRDINGKSVDWRTLYMEAKEEEENNKKLGKSRKKDRQKNAEKRDKEKKKREKEKEKIKKKMQAAQSMKSSIASQSELDSLVSEDDDSSMMSSKKSASKYKKAASVRSTKKIAPITEEGEEEDLDDDLNIWEKSKNDTRSTKSKKKSSKGQDNNSIKEEESGKEDVASIAAGDFANTAVEEGTKQRKVNKRLTSYEASDKPDGDMKKDL